MPNTRPLLLLLLVISLALPTALAFTPSPSTSTSTCTSARPRRKAPATRVAALPFLTTPTPVSPSAPLLTQDEIDTCAASFGLELRLSTLGPFYRVIARLIDDAEGSEPIGYTSGFVAPPFKLVHLDTMEVRRRYWKQLEGSKKFPYGCGLLLGAAAMRHAYDKGCRKAELLAINDDEKSHRLLLGFYRTAGFVAVKEVTNEIGCVPDLLVWGGIGTRMDMPVEDYLRRWRSVIVSRGEEFIAGARTGSSSSSSSREKEKQQEAA